MDYSDMRVVGVVWITRGPACRVYFHHTWQRTSASPRKGRTNNLCLELQLLRSNMLPLEAIAYVLKLHFHTASFTLHKKTKQTNNNEMKFGKDLENSKIDEFRHLYCDYNG